jgi:hypothetical protein
MTKAEALQKILDQFERVDNPADFETLARAYSQLVFATLPDKDDDVKTATA